TEPWPGSVVTGLEIAVRGSRSLSVVRGLDAEPGISVASSSPGSTRDVEVAFFAPTVEFSRVPRLGMGGSGVRVLSLFRRRMAVVANGNGMMHTQGVMPETAEGVRPHESAVTDELTVLATRLARELGAPVGLLDPARGTYRVRVGADLDRFPRAGAE